MQKSNKFPSKFSKKMVFLSLHQNTGRKFFFTESKANIAQNASQGANKAIYISEIVIESPQFSSDHQRERLTEQN